MRNQLIILSTVFLPACNLIPDHFGEDGPFIPPAEVVETAPLDDATASPQAETVPGFSGTASTIAGLGDPTVPGLWMETPLVAAEQVARVRSGTGAEVTLTLRPIAGEASAGSQLSIDAMRALGAPLTELVELKVSAAS